MGSQGGLNWVPTMLVILWDTIGRGEFFCMTMFRAAGRSQSAHLPANPQVISGMLLMARALILCYIYQKILSYCFRRHIREAEGMGSRCLVFSQKPLSESLGRRLLPRWERSITSGSSSLLRLEAQKWQRPRLQHTQAHARRVTSPPTRGRSPLKPNEEVLAVDRLDELLHDALRVVKCPTIPNEATIMDSLRTCESLAKVFVRVTSPRSSSSDTQITPATNLLFLDEKDDVSRPPESVAVVAKAIRQQAVNKLSDTVYKIVTSPQVFITPAVLDLYVNIQSLLGRPETLSQVFSLYAKKPVPTPNSSPIQYTAANPNKAASAVPSKAANTALDAAIEAKNLPLCLDIINTTVCAPAFRRSKIYKKAAVPLATFAVAPLAAYTVASQLSAYQNTMSPEMATNIAFAGILAYVGLTATTGVVALTTANDQMDRVTWATGMPLRERWFREEERAMIDRVAGAWGFKESWRRGDEEGQDWVALKEFCGLMGMVLDRAELMEGME